jgi:uncharacterized protein
LLYKTNKVIRLPLKIKKCTTFLQRLRGLMFKRKPINNEGILLMPCNSIHMFFMFFSIDVVFLDKKNQVVAVKKNVRPWRIVLPVRNAYAALELPPGSVNKYHINEGAVIEIP